MPQPVSTGSGKGSASMLRALRNPRAGRGLRPREVTEPVTK